MQSKLTATHRRLLAHITDAPAKGNVIIQRAGYALSGKLRSYLADLLTWGYADHIPGGYILRRRTYEQR